MRKQDNPLYQIWMNMKARCNNPNRNRYHCYGGRGIRVCEEWSRGSEVFIGWAEENGWRKGLQLDRIDNDGDYCPENCRITTHRKNIQTSSRSEGRDLPQGVSKNKKRFMARIGWRSKQIHLGTWDVPESAGRVYQRAARMIEEYELDN